MPFSGHQWAIKEQRFCCRQCAKAHERIDLTGMRFGRLIVSRHAGGNKWDCVCVCGGKARPTSQNLRLGRANSCGCLSKETAARLKTTHGGHKSPTYVTWSLMLKRCRTGTDPKFAFYGGRGIDFDPRWTLFENFLADMGERPRDTSIDRIDGNKGYWTDNCRWATRTQQQRNIRSNRMITHDGETLCASEWAERLSIPRGTIYARIARGLDGSAALGLNRRQECGSPAAT